MKEIKDEKASGGREPVKFLVHRCKFVEYIHPAIALLCLDPYSRGRQLGCVRKTGDIELWGRWKTQLYCEKIIYGSPDLVPTSIIWIPRSGGSERGDDDNFKMDVWPRLFAFYLSGEIIEWDVNTLKPLSKTIMGGGAINCAKVSPIERNVLAFGSDDCKLRIAKVDGDSIELVTLSETSRSKILTLDWVHDGKSIICAGIEGKITSFDSQSGRIIDQMKLPKPKDKIIWTIKCLPENFFVTGDSSGEVIFWDIHMYLPLRSFQSHDAEVLSLECNTNGTAVWSAGVDQKIVGYCLHKKNESESIWVPNGHKKYHTHDVYSLLYIEGQPDFLLSTGMDSNIIYISPVTSFPNSKPIRMPCYPSKPIIQIQRENRLLLAKYPDSIKVIKLSDEPLINSESGVNNEKLLLHFKPSLNSNIISTCISQNATWIAISDSDQTRIYKFKLNKALQGQEKCISRFKLSIDIKLPPGNLLTFHGKNKLIMATLNGELCVLNIGENENLSCEPVVGCQNSTIVSLTVSYNGTWIACGLANNTIIIYNMKSMQVHMTITPLKFLHTSLTFLLKSEELVVTLISNEFFIYDIPKKTLNQWSAQNSTSLPKFWLNMADYVMGVSSPENNKDLVVLYGPRFSCFVNMKKNIFDGVITTSKNLKRKASMADENDTSISRKCQEKLYMKLEHRYAPLMMSGFLSDNELVVVEHPVLKFLNALPLSFTKRIFGV